MTVNVSFSASASPPVMTISQVIAYMTQLTAYQDIAESFLQTLGDGNWLMGGVAPTARRSGNSLLERYLGALGPHALSCY